jgi:hypothetical protein
LAVNSGGGGATTFAPATSAALQPAASTLDGVGRGAGVSFPTRTQDQPVLLEGDKPLVVYVGAEYCPYCGSQRWPLVIALNRFGTFNGLATARTPNPAIATVSFHGATYTSDFLVFQGVELTDVNHDPLDTLTPQQEQLMSVFNAPPYTTGTGAVPFLDFGNQFVQTGSSIDTQMFDGLTHEEIEAALINEPSGAIAQAVYGSANAFTAILCSLTGGEPGNVCTTPAVTAYQQEVG